jgi:hypothetical protein
MGRPGPRSAGLLHRALQGQCHAHLGQARTIATRMALLNRSRPTPPRRPPGLEPAHRGRPPRSEQCPRSVTPLRTAVRSLIRRSGFPPYLNCQAGAQPITPPRNPTDTLRDLAGSGLREFGICGSKEAVL